MRQARVAASPAATVSRRLRAVSAVISMVAGTSLVRLRPALGLLGLAFVCNGSLAQPTPTVNARDAWARATTPGVATGGVYVTLTSPAGDKLTGVTSPAVARADVHEMQMDGSIMRMRAVQGGLNLPPGRAVILSPSGYHIMLEGLRAPLRQRSTISVRLLFQNAPPVDIQAQVQSIGAAGPVSGHAGHDAMPGMSMPK